MWLDVCVCGEALYLYQKDSDNYVLLKISFEQTLRMYAWYSQGMDNWCHRGKGKKDEKSNSRVKAFNFSYQQQKGLSKTNGTPKSSILIGVSIIFTMHFGGPIPIFANGV